jgi:hypothetical protein
MTKWFKEVVVKGVPHTVPRYVVRIDAKTTHGWQVRYAGKSKLFSDGQKGAARALQSAAAYLLSVFDEKRVSERKENTSKQIKTGVSGVRVATDLSNNKVSFLVFDALTRKSKRVHIGTLNTLEKNLTPAGLKALKLSEELHVRFEAEKVREQAEFKAALEEIA